MRLKYFAWVRERVGPGIGPSRKRALLHHFGTLKEIERASIADLGKVPGVSAESARKIFEFFHAQAG